MFLVLKIAISPLACTALLPMATETPCLRFKQNLSIALAGLARHDFISAFGDFSKTGGPPIQSKTDGIKNCGLSRPCRAGQGKNAVGYIFRAAKINNPFTVKGIEIFKSKLEYLHDF